MKNVKNKPKIYGLTGGIASGKSITANFFIEHNIKVFDSDKYVKELYLNNSELINKVNTKYKIDINTLEGKTKLSNIIFNNELERMYLNSLIHPLVFQGIDEFIENNIKEDFLIIDMPLLFEVGYDKKVFKSILIYTSKKIQVKRLMNRDSLSKTNAMKRINSQLSLKDKKKMADYIIKNNKDKEDLYKQLESLIGVLKDESK